MFQLVRLGSGSQDKRSLASFLLGCFAFVNAASFAADDRLPVKDADASSPAEMKPYAESIEHIDAKIDLLPIPGGTFTMGSPAGESGRGDDEGPQHSVKIDPFWMSKFELTWDVFEIWMFDLDIARRQAAGLPANARDKAADFFQLSQPTKPYTDMTFGMGKRGFPVICMTQEAGRCFCDWLSAKTGRYYRLPTEAEWEYACRAGAKTAYSFGDDPALLGQYAWFADNSDEKYQKVGLKKPNPWGLHDMHGNVAEWVLDQHTTTLYRAAELLDNPLAVPKTEYGRVVRGGSWQDEADGCRSAKRSQSNEDWKQQDPQFPQSIWYFTDALHVGFRIVRPLRVPSAEERRTKWDSQEPKINRRSKG